MDSDSDCSTLAPATKKNGVDAVPDATKIPRPPNAFILYRNVHQPLLVASHKGQGMSSRDFSSMIGEQWRNEDPRIKQKFQNDAKTRMLEHRDKYPNYKYRPNVKAVPKLQPLAKSAPSKRGAILKKSVKKVAVRDRDAYEISSAEESDLIKGDSKMDTAAPVVKRKTSKSTVLVPRSKSKPSLTPSPLDDEEPLTIRLQTSLFKRNKYPTFSNGMVSANAAPKVLVKSEPESFGYPSSGNLSTTSKSPKKTIHDKTNTKPYNRVRPSTSYRSNSESSIASSHQSAHTKQRTTNNSASTATAADICSSGSSCEDDVMTDNASEYEFPSVTFSRASTISVAHDFEALRVQDCDSVSFVFGVGHRVESPALDVDDEETDDETFVPIKEKHFFPISGSSNDSFTSASSTSSSVIPMHQMPPLVSSNVDSTPFSYNNAREQMTVDPTLETFQQVFVYDWPSPPPPTKTQHHGPPYSIQPKHYHQDQRSMQAPSVTATTSALPQQAYFANILSPSLSDSATPTLLNSVTPVIPPISVTQNVNNNNGFSSYMSNQQQYPPPNYHSSILDQATNSQPQAQPQAHPRPFPPIDSTDYPFPSLAPRGLYAKPKKTIPTLKLNTSNSGIKSLLVVDGMKSAGLWLTSAKVLSPMTCGVMFNGDDLLAARTPVANSMSAAAVSSGSLFSAFGGSSGGATPRASTGFGGFFGGGGNGGRRTSVFEFLGGLSPMRPSPPVPGQNPFW
ncbi:UNVERIFIED_CONTAM: hypothetical protein HDU68_000311 [Siphonaria sp. JEL0065]|nr:hypothetical protein HDU68_000311 [Siphonaria sp. JEL0065]